MKANNRVCLLIALWAAATILQLLSAVATPTGPTAVNLINSSRRELFESPKIAYAQAGNVSELIIEALTITANWQGYYGNVSGNIVLDDAEGSSMYNWNLADPQGEIYAANTTVTSFATVSCVNLASNGLSGNLNESILETNYNISTNAGDGISETFNWTYAGSFQVGTKTINAAGSCPLVYTNVNDAGQARDFPEVILGADNNATLIFTALLNQSIDGFKTGSNDKYDFQMLVAENGGNPSTTPYYFYVELS